MNSSIQADFISYVDKSIKYKALRYKQKAKRRNDREQLILNVVNSDFNEEKINTIADKEIDFEEEIIHRNKVVCFHSVLTERRILSALNKLTDKQKEILNMCTIQNRDEKEIAEILKISTQSVNKTKNRAIRKIRHAIGG